MVLKVNVCLGTVLYRKMCVTFLYSYIRMNVKEKQFKLAYVFFAIGFVLFINYVCMYVGVLVLISVANRYGNSYTERKLKARLIGRLGAIKVRHI